MFYVLCEITGTLSHMKVYNDLLSKQSLQDTVRNIFEKVLFALTI